MWHGLRSEHRGADRGTSLIEVVVAVVILAILSTAVLSVILKTQTGQISNRARIAAANLAAREIDLVREEFLRSDLAPVTIADAGTLTNPHPLDGQTAGQPLRVDATDYTVVRSVNWNITGDGQSACEGGALVVYPTLGVTVSVSWANMGFVKPIMSFASLAPAKGQGIPGDASFVAVKVVDARGAPNPGRSVTVTSASETRTGLTDATGCAVVQVNPAAAGTAFTATMSDTGYVDISGTTNPAKTTGTLLQGQLNHEISFAYDRAGTVRVTLADPGGGALTDDDVWGAQMTLVASESSGTSSSSAYVATTVRTVIAGLWPGNYGAYYGTVAPVGGYLTQELAPGGTIDISVPFEIAASQLTGLPTGTTGVVAVPAGGGCTGASARAVDPAGFSVLPGIWDFYASGPTFSCSPGPFDVELVAGVNSDIPWEATTLRLTGVPVGGTVWAVERSKASAPVTTCPTASAAVAVNLDGSRTGPVDIPAGDWYLFMTDGAAGGACVNFPASINPSTIEHGVANVVAWPAAATAITIRVTGVPTTDKSTYPSVVASPTKITVSSCQRNTFPAAGTVTLTRTSGTTYEATAALGTWYIYAWDRGPTKNFAEWSPRCRWGGTMIAGTANPLILPFNESTHPTVGP
ncbi:MAG: prepilin-type N-terminal cleavage/methylation domain-containing protein [Cellulomonas sp.]